jgi:hypothetical protein
MVVLTCANRPVKKYGTTKVNFRAVIAATARKAQECGYRPVVFDLGTLGVGERHVVEDVSFTTNGYYSREPLPNYKTKSLFKPDLVQIALDRHNDTIAYLDGDAQLIGCLGDVQQGDYDIGVTLRPKWETESAWHKQYVDIVKFINAGVIFFKPTPAAVKFVGDWKRRTAEVGNDQMALNRMACPERYPGPYSTHTLNGCRIKYFPCEEYNFYFFGMISHEKAKILHFKGNVRQYYPFGATKRLYCRLKLAARTVLRRKPVVELG